MTRDFEGLRRDLHGMGNGGPAIGIARGLIVAAAVASVPALAQDPPASTSDRPYTVVEGYKVDANTMNGFRAWRAASCDRCHGASQQGLVGPSLVESLKTLRKEDFARLMKQGRLEKGMPSFAESATVMGNVDGLYAYLKGRSNGDITQAKVEELK
jgi:mono/diheme cytochrome c family protein